MRTCFRKFVAAIVAVCAIVSSAQDNKPQDTLVLSPFSVVTQKEYGYRATNSVTATGIGTEIYRTPINVSVITGELIRDIGASSLREALQYTASYTGDRRDPRDSGSGGAALRGFPLQGLVNRLSGSIRNPVPDFIEQVEIVKGPNAVFFGRVAPNGILNMITLRPKSVTATTVRATYGSYGYSNLFVDHNEKIGSHAALRLAGSYLDQTNGYYDYNYRQSTNGYGAFTWDITPSIKLNIIGSTMASKENKLHSMPRTNPAYVEFTRNNPTTTLGPIQWGTANLPPNTPIITTYYDPANVFSNGSRGNNSGPDAFQKDVSKFLQTEILANPLNWLNIRAAHAYSDDNNLTLENTGYPTFDGTYLAGGGPPSYRYNRIYGNTFEGEAVANFSLGPTAHRLLLGGRLYYPKIGAFSVSGTAFTWNTKTQGPRPILSRGYPNGLPNPAITYASGDEKAVYVIDQISLYNERVKILGGVRKTEVSNNSRLPGAITSTQTETTPMVGLLVEAAKGFVLFGNYSESFEPQFNRDAVGNLASNIRGEGYETGAKLNLLDGRFSGAISYFDVTRTGEVRRDFTREQTTGITPLFIPGGTQASQGTDLEIYYAPKNNLQFILSYTRLLKAEVTQDTTQPWIIGTRLRNAPPYTGALFSKYTYESGNLKGVFVTGGVRIVGEVNPIVSAQFAIKQPEYTVCDVGVGYEGKFKGREIKVQLNVKNLLNESYYDGQFTLADPLTAYLRVETRF